MKLYAKLSKREFWLKRLVLLDMLFQTTTLSRIHRKWMQFCNERPRSWLKRLEAVWTSVGYYRKLWKFFQVGIFVTSVDLQKVSYLFWMLIVRKVLEG